MIVRDVARRPGIQTKLLPLLSVLLLGVMLTSGLATTASGEGWEELAAAAPECCFTNPEYAGGCIVSPSAEETCSSILHYLNDPASSGKSYCGFTEIRGGWQEARCPGERTRESSADHQCVDFGESDTPTDT